jgi:hypothetical protein
LADGRSVRAVQILPAQMFYKPSDLDWQIIRYTIASQKAEASCYRALKDGLSPELASGIPDICAIELRCR